MKIQSSKMDRKHGKYIVNVEHSENQPPITCSNDQEAHSPARWHLPSNDIIDDVPSNLTGVCVSPGVLAHSGYPHTELSHTQVKGNGCCNWSLWNVFLACLLACVITTAIGVLVICLVNNRGNNNSTIVINLPSKDREPVIIVHETTTASPPTVTITSAEPATTASATSTGPPTTASATSTGPPTTASATSTGPPTTTDTTTSLTTASTLPLELTTGATSTPSSS
ncbi:dynactin-associated protein [Pteropus alecto]|nr:dynactin-associated protein [Pteropus alecto]